MAWKRKARGGLLCFVGFMLSPLSWWNDLFVNLPLAVSFGWLVSLAHAPSFEAATIIGYWLTNVLGFVLMHKGAQQLAPKKGEEQHYYSTRSLLRDVAVACLYTLLLVLLVKLKAIKPLAGYFPTP